MARDCYALVFKATYNQAIADGLAVSVATAAAQSAMEDCLKQQSTTVPTVQPNVTVPGHSVDRGPAGGATDRSAVLGQRQK